MRSSEILRALVAASALVASCVVAAPARAQEQARGFAVQRLYPSAPGAGWFAMDALDVHGGLGGAMALTVGYARDPLRVGDGAQRLSVVSDQLIANFGFAATWDRFRFYASFDAPLASKGTGGVVQGFSYTAPHLDLGSDPDTLADARLGIDARIYGDPHGAFRLGLGAQLFFPNGTREDYISDDTYRAMFRLLVAGDVGRFTYAAKVGVHVRPLDEPSPGSPRGSELLFGVAAGAKIPIAGGTRTLVVGPEIFGETAFKSAFGASTTGVEGLLSARVEGTREAPQLRVKVGVGGGIHAQFGAPEWRAVVGVEVFTTGLR